MLTLRKLKKLKFEERIIEAVDATGKIYRLKAIKNLLIFPYEILIPAECKIKALRSKAPKEFAQVELHFINTGVCDPVNIAGRVELATSSEEGIKYLKIIAANSSIVYFSFTKEGIFANACYDYKIGYMKDGEYKTYDGFIALRNEDYINEDYLLKVRY